MNGPDRRAGGGRVRSFGLLTLMTLAACGSEDLERPTRVSAEMPIEYPLELWDQGIEGKCLLKVRVNAMGIVDSVVVVETSGYTQFDSAAIRGARRIQFLPARRGGKRIDVWAQVPVHFSRRSGP